MNFSTIGPFCRLRGGTIIGKSVKIGNFVEIKKSKILVIILKLIILLM